MEKTTEQIKLEKGIIACTEHIACSNLSIISSGFNIVFEALSIKKQKEFKSIIPIVDAAGQDLRNLAISECKKRFQN